MRNVVDSKRKAWTTPALRVLDPSVEAVRQAASRSPEFAAAVRRHLAEESDARPLAM
jgi:hypothetical protein